MSLGIKGGEEERMRREEGKKEKELSGRVQWEEERKGGERNVWMQRRLPKINKIPAPVHRDVFT